MWFKIDLYSSLSLNEQIKMGIKESILKGKLREGDTLPSIRELASSLRVNPNTIVRAYKDLET
ncbi:MAG: GntR family transcriptional regulator, partial [Thermotogae bacterium]|nr:GntR family transcriptional regulator [Thermotogota bacterium]